MPDKIETKGGHPALRNGVIVSVFGLIIAGPEVALLAGGATYLGTIAIRQRKKS